MNARRHRSGWTRPGSRPSAWLAIAWALLVGLGLPAAPAVHVLADHAGDHAAHAESGHAEGGCAHDPGPAPTGPEHAPAGDHDESSCATCVQLALSKRAGLTGSPPLAMSVPAVSEPLSVHTLIGAASVRLGRDGSPRGPPLGPGLA